MTLNGHYALYYILHACLSELTTKISMEIDPYCQQQKCSPLNVVYSDIRVMQIFLGVREIWGRQSKVVRAKKRFFDLCAAISRKRRKIRPKLLLITNRKLIERFRLV